MVYRISKGGFFLACTSPDCKTTQPVDPQGKPKLREVSEYKCPKCGREMIKRQGRFGIFLGCSGYSVKNEDGQPSCNLIINLDKEGNPQPPKAPPLNTDVKCPKCQSMMYLRDGKRGPWLSCSKFPKCRGMQNLSKVDEATRQTLEARLPELKAKAQEGLELVAKLKGEAPPPAGGATGTGAKGTIPTDIDCDECGAPMVVRFSRRGAFLGCSHYPKCKNTGQVPEKLLEELGLSTDGKQTDKPQQPEADHDDLGHTDLTM
jgi:ssDNA-binding Zn-finger/Zn-ribbon topoisomerase 1